MTVAQDRFRSLLASFAFIVTLPFGAEAVAAANPTLFAEARGVADEELTRVLRLSSLKIDVAIEGSIAQTTLVATFAGLPDEEVEGHFALVLPENAVVNGYALDIEGELIAGVLLARPRAQEFYDSKVRKAIDPGLASVSTANVFQTQVYPIRESLGRTIRVSFVTPLHRGLVLPLETAERVGDVAIRITATDVEAAPSIVLPNGLPATWHRTRTGHVATVAANDTSLSGALSVAPTTPRRAALVSTHASGQRFFQIRDSWRAALPTPRPQRIRVYWDASLSRRDDRLTDELALLRRYVRFARGAPVDLVVFNSTAAHVITAGTLEDVSRELEAVTYRGGTSFAVIDSLRLPHADVCLLFSDGMATIDRRDTFVPTCTLKAIVSSPDADRGYLTKLTRNSGGIVIRLGDAAEAAYRRLIEEAPIIAGATTVEGRPLDFSILDNGSDGWLVVGEAPRTGDIVLEIKSRRGAPLENRYYSRAARSTRFDGIAALWAADQIMALTVANEAFEEVERVARRFSVPTPSHAFIVLEAPRDYADAGVAPPHNYPQDAKREYLQAKASLEEERFVAEGEHLASLYEAWQDQKEWWGMEGAPRDHAEAFAQKWRRARRPDRSSQDIDEPRGIFVGGGFGDGRHLEEIIVTAALRRPYYYDAPVPIAVEAFDSARPYLRALEAAAPEHLDAVLAEQLKSHGRLPAFYLDSAEWLFRRHLVTEASEMALAALELPLANDDTRSIVADRLIRYGYLDRGVWLHEQVARVAEHRPQPQIQLALALAKRASIRTASAKRDLQRAIAILNDVAMTPWGEAYAGVALSALMEANALIPRLRRLGGTRVALSPDLIALLDLDVRVVIQWNTAATDLDLWVDEPNGERAIYSNRATSSGGLLSQDMTEGYGPEEYLLRQAEPGEYRVHIDVYDTDSINPNGATIVTARLIHNFGRPSEYEESVDVELLPDAEGERFVGSIRVGGAE